MSRWKPTKLKLNDSRGKTRKHSGTATERTCLTLTQTMKSNSKREATNRGSKNLARQGTQNYRDRVQVRSCLGTLRAKRPVLVCEGEMPRGKQRTQRVGTA